MKYSSLSYSRTSTELEEDAKAINWWFIPGQKQASRLFALWNRTAGDCLLDSVLQVNSLFINVLHSLPVTSHFFFVQLFSYNSEWLVHLPAATVLFHRGQMDLANAIEVYRSNMPFSSLIGEFSFSYCSICR